MHLRGAFHLGHDPALVRLARAVHAADIASELHTDPLGPGLLATGLGGIDVEADDHQLLERPSSTTRSMPGAGERWPHHRSTPSCPSG
ncbi:MAG: chromate resistance protein [Chloroflexi bacterium]|nr:MAG: chromate resistance protein [Chloroflexota bacterium]